MAGDVFPFLRNHCHISLSRFFPSPRRDERDTKILHILRQRTTDVEVKKYCVGLLKKAGSFDYTKAVLEELDGKIREEIARLGGNQGLLTLLDELKNWA